MMLCVKNHIRYMKLTIVRGKKELGFELICCSSGDTEYMSINGIIGELY